MADEHDLEIVKCLSDVAKQAQREKTTRTRIVCTSILAGIGTIVYGVLQYNEPAWVTVVLALITAFTIPASVVWRLVQVYLRNSEKYNRRTAALEERIDPNRSSSSRPTIWDGSDELLQLEKRRLDDKGQNEE
jgi:O-antigen ligase